MQWESGFLFCRTCLGLVDTRAGNGGCVGQALHDIMSSAEYKVASFGGFPADTQGGWAWCQKCSKLVCRFLGPGVCHDGAGHEFTDEPVSMELGVPFGPHDVAEYEPEWRWCNRCQSLFRPDPARGADACFAGGAHDQGGSWELWARIVRVEVQTWWNWCPRCQGLARAGVCHDGDAHGGGPQSYGPVFGVAPPGSQDGWRMCVKCGLMTYRDNGGGPCFGGGTHDLSGGYTYSIPIDTLPDGGQPGWRWCNRCGVLSLAQPTVGPCAAGGVHDNGGSGAYRVVVESVDNGQPGWRRCARCDGMVFTRLTPGVCLDGAAHDVASGPWHSVPIYGEAVEAPAGWRQCRTCRTLYYSYDGPGVCLIGAPHDPTDSAMYVVPVTPPSDRSQDGWRRCAHCRQLAFEGGGGRCVSGRPHDFAGSLAYVLATRPDPADAERPPPAPAGPRLVVAESAERIVFDGTGFAADGAVDLLILHSGQTTTVALTADGAGAFRHVAEPVEANPAGGSAVARQKGGGIATARLTQFVPVKREEIPR